VSKTYISHTILGFESTYLAYANGRYGGVLLFISFFSPSLECDVNPTLLGEIWPFNS